MKIFSHETISQLEITPLQCIEWVKECFLMKYDCDIPPKISMHQNGDIFYNTMPCFIPSLNRFGVKEVSRFPLKEPALNSDLLLYENGELLGLFDATWITAMRTGAVAATAIKALQHHGSKTYALMGLGNTATATMLCLNEILPDNSQVTVKLLRYKNQSERFRKRFKDFEKFSFMEVGTKDELVSGSDVVISCVTSESGTIAPDHCYKDGVLVVPIHTRGFQNCDLFFDKVFADDEGHVKGFKYFDRFKKFDELSHVLSGASIGRENEKERILSYNIGISLHDVYFASKIYDIAKDTVADTPMKRISDKFWI